VSTTRQLLDYCLTTARLSFPKGGAPIYTLSDKLKSKVTDLNQLITEKYKEVLSIDRRDLRSFIETHIGQIKSLEKLDLVSLNGYQNKGGILGVDGSNNKIGGAYPHFVEAYQALAKSTCYKDMPIVLADIYSPLYPEKEESPLKNREAIIDEKKNIRLASLEVEAALEAINQFKPYAILMDGGLIRYNIYAYDKWMELRELCEERGILLVGVIKDIKTSIIGNKMKEINPGLGDSFYDREILFGKLKYGEMINIRDEVNKKLPEGYSSAFIRTSLAPTPIGMDIINSQKDYMEEMARLIFTLTPENSRGVPLWLDIVDKEVKISDEIMKALLERYMDRDIYERFFISERDKRN